MSITEFYYILDEYCRMRSVMGVIFPVSDCTIYAHHK